MQERVRDEEGKEMSAEEQLQEDQGERIGVTGLLTGRWSEEMTQSYISSPWGSEVPFGSQIV